MVAGKLKSMVEHFSVVVLSGARQVGKSTLLKHIFPDYSMVVFDPSIDVGNARQDPDLFLDNHPSPLILDEIQYAPELVSCIKRRVDIDRQPGRYILTGSQQWSVMKTLAESLAGRAVFLDLEGFSWAEISEDVDAGFWLKHWLSSPERALTRLRARSSSRSVYEQLWRGGLPAADTLPLEFLPDFFSGYFRTYIERDARLLMDIGDWQQFGRFVQLVAALTSQEVNNSKLGREIGVTPQTARRWLGVLKATFQWFEVSPYSGNSLKRIAGKAKGYISDTGLVCFLQRISSPEALAGHPLAGALFESAVMAEIRKLMAAEAVPPILHHWRSHGGAEVDILLERDSIFYPVEVKLSTTPSKHDTRGITAFRKTYPHLQVAPGLVITPGNSAADDALLWKISDRDYALSWRAV